MGGAANPLVSPAGWPLAPRVLRTLGQPVGLAAFGHPDRDSLAGEASTVPPYGDRVRLAGASRAFARVRASAEGVAVSPHAALTAGERGASGTVV